MRSSKTSVMSRFTPVIALSIYLAAGPVHADIFRWDNGEVIPGTQGVTLAPGVVLSSGQLIYADLAFNLTGASFANANLTDASFSWSSSNGNITNADFTNATIEGTHFAFMTDRGFTAAQLYSTASYAAKNLSRIDFTADDLAGWNFSGQNLTNARLWLTELIATDFSHANLTNAAFDSANLSSANLQGAIIARASFKHVLGFTAQQIYSTVSYATGDLSYIKLKDITLDGINLAGKNLTGANFELSSLTSANFVGANLTGAMLHGTWLEGASFVGANLTGADFGPFYSAVVTNRQSSFLSPFDSQTKLANADFTGADLRNARFYFADLANAKFAGADVRGTQFVGVDKFTPAQLYATASYQTHDLTGIGLRSLDLTNANFDNQNLHGASLAGSTIDNASFVNALVDGASFDTTGLTQTQLYGTASYINRNLNHMNLGGLNLAGWNFIQQNLTGTTFGLSNLTGTQFVAATLTSAYFYQAILNRADFTNAQLDKSYFYSSSVTDADFSGANLSQADLHSENVFIVGGILGSPVFNFANAQPAAQTNVYIPGNISVIYWPVAAATDLSRSRFVGANLTGADLGRTFLTRADFAQAILNGTSFRDADLRGAVNWVPAATTITTNAIRPDGMIQGLNLGSLENFSVRYNAIPILVTGAAVADPTSTLQFLIGLDGASTLHFAPGLIPTLLGKLELDIDPSVDPASLVGHSFDLFDWNGPVAPDHQFVDVIFDPTQSWDLSQLYTTGIVVLIGAPPAAQVSVPEPASLALLGAAALPLLARRREKPVNR